MQIATTKIIIKNKTEARKTPNNNNNNKINQTKNPPNNQKNQKENMDLEVSCHSISTYVDPSEFVYLGRYKRK